LGGVPGAFAAAAFSLVTSSPAATSGRGYDGVTALAEEEAVDEAAEEEALPPAERRPVPALDPPPPRQSWVYSNLFGLRINPLGLGDELLIGSRWNLIQRSGALYRDSFVALKLHTFLTPSFLHAGPRFELQPLSVIGIAVTYDVLGYFGNIGQVLGYPSPWGDFSDSARRERVRAGENRAAFGHSVRFSSLLQARVGPVAVRHQAHFTYADLRLEPGYRVYYDQAIDLLQPDGGWSLVSDLDAFVFLPKGWLLGARYTATLAFYRARHVPPEEVDRDRSLPPLHRLGPAVLFTFFDDPARRFNRPTLILLTQWWIQHPWRTGVDVHPAIPYAAVAFSFEGSWHSRRAEAAARRRRIR